MKIAIINGPNLNLLGKREPGIYGSQSFETFFEALQVKYPQVTFSYYQSNIEGELINEIHFSKNDAAGLYMIKIVVDDQVYKGQIIYQR